MKPLLSILVGIPPFIYFVVNPLRAILLMSIAISNYGDNNTALRMLSQAHTINPKNNQILYLIGDIAVLEKKYQVALWAYATGITNSPGDAMFRAKYGVTLNMMGFDGFFAIKEAQKLEPNNPNFSQEITRLTELLKHKKF